MFIEIGPASLVIKTERNSEPHEPDRMTIEGFVRESLKGISENLPVLRQKAYRIKRFKNMPSVARRMIEAVRRIDEETLTPMASVAGAVSDEVKDFLKADGYDLIAVNNGGDMSIFNKDSYRNIRISIGDINKNINTPYILNIRELSDYGIATSGIGGRSLSLGIAEIGTVIAETSAVADAAATLICNMTNIDSERIVRKRASEIDPMTDIPDEFVTVSIGELNKDEIHHALSNGLICAYNLLKVKAIIDSFIYFRGSMVTTITGDKSIKLEVLHGD